MDVKAANIVVDGNGNGHLVDFNLAYEYAPDEDSYSISNRCGSISYIAPEMTSTDSKLCGFKLDVWSFGITFVALCYKRLPFEECHPRCAMFRDFIVSTRNGMEPSSVLDDAYELFRTRGDVTDAHRRIIDVCLSPSPQQRASMDRVLFMIHSLH